MNRRSFVQKMLGAIGVGTVVPLTASTIPTEPKLTEHVMGPVQSRESMKLEIMERTGCSKSSAIREILDIQHDFIKRQFLSWDSMYGSKFYHDEIVNVEYGPVTYCPTTFIPQQHLIVTTRERIS